MMSAHFGVSRKINTRSPCTMDFVEPVASSQRSILVFVYLFAIVCGFQTTSAADGNYDLVLVADLSRREIFVAPALTFNFTRIPGLAIQPFDVDYDPVDAMVYWTDGRNAISRAFLDGSGFEVLLSDLEAPEGLRLDIVNRVIYWTDSGSDLIERATMDGQERSVVVNLTHPSLGDVKPRSIVLGADNRYLYWTDWGVNPKIERSATDGSDRRVLVDTNLTWPNGLALDPQGQRLYWCDARTHLIESSDLLGGDRRTLLNLPVDYEPFDIGVYNGWVYWTDWAFRTIVRLDSMLTSVTRHGSKSFTRAGGLRIYKDMMEDHTCQQLMPCQYGGRCRQYSSHYECVCRDGFTGTNCELDLVCPASFQVLAQPGFTETHVSWKEPVLTGYDGPSNVTSNATPGAVFDIGLHEIVYRQRFESYQILLQCSFTVEVVGRCASNTTYEGPRTLTWLATIAGFTAKSVERCQLSTQNAGQPLAVRNCSVVGPPVFFQWNTHELRSCGEAKNEVTIQDVTEVEVSQGNVVEVAEFLANQTSESTKDAEDVRAVSKILENIVQVESGDVKVTRSVVKTVSNVIQSVKTTPDQSVDDAGSSSAIVQSVETQVSLTLQQEGQVRIQQDTVHVEAVSLALKKASGGFSFVSTPQSPGQQDSSDGRQRGTLTGTEVKTFENASDIPKDVVAAIGLPANIVDLLQSSDDNSSKSLRASFILYADDTLFKSAKIEGYEEVNGSSVRIEGAIVSLNVQEVELVNLTEPVVIEFQTPAMNETERNRTTIRCVFWDFDLNDGVGDWSTAGCKLSFQTDDKVSCQCSHATNFAVLLDVKGQEPNGKDPATKALDVISQVGCSLSIIALSVTLIIYLANRRLRSGISRQIFIHFCISLLMLYIVFLAGVDNAQGSGGGCVFVAALLHYLTLSTMMWMAVEARNMYISTVTVFPENRSRYMLKVCLVAWVSPLIILTITLAAATDHYQNEHYCFLRPGLVLYLSLLVPIGLILIHNIVTFVLVMRSLLEVKEASRSQQISKRLQNAVGISALMGLTWCFGFLAIEGATFTFQLIFCLTNSLQGVIVFVMFCVRPEEVRAVVAPYFSRICCGYDCRLPKLRPTLSNDLQLTSESAPYSPSNTQATKCESFTAEIQDLGRSPVI
ncbi:adhesion G-protein coupled receptor G6-like [Acanthaster planci]|uniref:Adhesion G-protein coupled receptor G6-like n=1 Tax=Acanthaster planci TaxID=133434 RepID=A0A8B7Y951_ACAPL|nr:adhesion G-protein coupled receptor G6-like [Acanthaster planci]